MIVYAVVDTALSADFALGDSLEVFVRREDAERFIEEVRGDDPKTKPARSIATAPMRLLHWLSSAHSVHASSAAA